MSGAVQGLLKRSEDEKTSPRPRAASEGRSGAVNSAAGDISPDPGDLSRPVEMTHTARPDFSGPLAPAERIGETP